VEDQEIETDQAEETDLAVGLKVEEDLEIEALEDLLKCMMLLV
jgi:hypothetical protein